MKAVAATLRQRPGGEAIDTIVLACTHFPLLREEFAHVFGANTALVDGAQGIARRSKHLVGDDAFIPDTPIRFIVSGSVERTQGLEAALRQKDFAPAQAFP